MPNVRISHGGISSSEYSLDTRVWDLQNEGVSMLAGFRRQAVQVQCCRRNGCQICKASNADNRHTLILPSRAMASARKSNLLETPTSPHFVGELRPYYFGMLTGGESGGTYLLSRRNSRSFCGWPVCLH